MLLKLPTLQNILAERKFPKASPTDMFPRQKHDAPNPIDLFNQSANSTNLVTSQLR